MPALRSKHATVIGQPAPIPPKARRRQASSSGGIDWDAANKAATRPSQPPGLADVDDDWADDEATSVFRVNPVLEKKLSGAPPSDSMSDQAQTRVASGDELLEVVSDEDEETMVAESPLEAEDADEGDRLSQQEIQDAFARADAAVDALSGLEEMPADVAAAGGLGQTVMMDPESEEDLHSDLAQTVAIPEESPVSPEALALAERDALREGTREPAAEVEPLPRLNVEDSVEDSVDDSVRLAEPRPKPEQVVIEAAASVPGVPLAELHEEPLAAEPAPVEVRAPSPAPPAAEESPASGSPWSTASLPPAPISQPPPRLSKLSFALVSVGAAAVVMASGVLFVRSNATVPDIPAPTAQAPEPKKGKPPVLKKRVTPSAAPSATALPSGAASGVASAAPNASADVAAPPAAGAPPKDPTTLPFTTGYLRVAFPEAAADVVVYGKPSGKVGTYIEVPCQRMQNVRIREADNGRWLSDGRPVKVECRAVTEVSIPPK